MSDERNAKAHFLLAVIARICGFGISVAKIWKETHVLPSNVYDPTIVVKRTWPIRLFFVALPFEWPE